MSVRAESLVYPEKLRASGQLGAAIEAYRLVDIMYPGTPEAAKAREQIERIEKEMAKKLDDTKAARLLTLAKNLDKSGKTAAALDYYAQVVKAAPKSKEAAEASKRMAELKK